jgi:hypothetical protein
MDKSEMSDQQAENQIQHLMSDYKDQQSPRRSTFFAIQDRLNEQDGPSLRNRLSGISDLALWRIIPVSKQRIAQGLALVAIVIVVGAYFAFLGSDDDAGTGVAAELTGTPTVEEPQEATATVQAETTVEPTAITVSQTPLGKAFPAALMAGADPLKSDQVVELWTEYLTNAQVIGESKYQKEFTLCENGTGTGTIQEPGTNDGFTSNKFTWNITAGSEPWNEITLRMVVETVINDGSIGNERRSVYNFQQTIGHEKGTLVGELFDTINVVDSESDDCVSEPEIDSDVAAAIQLLENEFEAIRTSDIDLYVSGCDGEITLRAGGVLEVKAALEANWPAEGRDVRAENITLINRLKDFIILEYDLYENDQFVEVSYARIIFHPDRGVTSGSTDCGMKQ